MKIKPIASGSGGNFYIIEDGENTLLIECGIKFKEIKKALDFRLSQVDGCLLSHAHL